MKAPAHPVFVGGSGSSGTTITAKLIGAHSSYALIPREVNFHADPLGLVGVLQGKHTMDECLERSRGVFRYLHHSGRERGIFALVDEERFESALTRFREQFPDDGAAAARELVHTILDPVAEAAAKPFWVEMSPRNAAAAPTLLDVFPDAKVVHSVRDGRDVAADKVRRGMKVPDAFAAMDWWAKKVIRGERAAEAAGDRMLTIRMEDLTVNARDETLRRLCAFLGVEEDEGMRQFFETAVLPDKAGIGSWRRILPTADHDAIDVRYGELVGALHGRGITALEEPEAAPAPAPASTATRASGPAELSDLVRAEPERIALVSTRMVGADDEDPCAAPFEELDLYQAFRDVLVEGSAWESTPFYEGVVAAIEAGEGRWGWRSKEDLDGQLAEAPQRLRSLRDGGSLEDPVTVVIRADGRLMLVDGADRLALARLAGLDEVPVRVESRHEDWIAFRERIHRYASRRRGRVYQVIDHPDLRELPAYHGTERFLMLRAALDGYPCEGKRLLDIGTHWGYMVQQMERLGFECTGVELSDECIRIGQGIRAANGSRYDLWHGAIFDFPDAEQQDIVLALNILHHLTKTEELHDGLVGFLRRLNADVIFFEPHLSHQPGKMDGAYRNYAPLEFTEFVAEHAGMEEITYLGRESEHYSQWLRPLFMLSRRRRRWPS